MRAVVAVIVAAALAAGSCGGDPADPQPPAGDQAARSSKELPAELLGSWTATPSGVRLQYVFRRAGTYRHLSVQRLRRPGGVSRFIIEARGTAVARGGTLRLRPRSGTKKLRDPAQPGRNYTRPLERFPQQYGWSVRRGRRGPELTLTIGGGLAVTYRRR